MMSCCRHSQQSWSWALAHDRRIYTIDRVAPNQLRHELERLLGVADGPTVRMDIRWGG